jgi:hypothetical protein
MIGSNLRRGIDSLLPPPLLGRIGKGGGRDRRVVLIPTPDPSLQGRGERAVQKAMRPSV